MHIMPGYFKKSFFLFLFFFVSCSFFIHQDAMAGSHPKSGDYINPGDTLDVLYLTRGELLNLPKKEIRFSFVVEKNNKPTLHGWSKGKKASGSNDKPDADIKLVYGCVSDAVYQADTKMENLVLTKKQVKNLRKQLEKAGTEYLVFKPVIENKLVRYEILLSSEMPVDRSRLPRATTTAIFASP